MPDKSKEYDAFVSYSHDDKPTVDWLARQLETRRVWWLAKRRRRLCVDNESFPAGGLSDAIKSALDNSEYLIVCRSTSSAGSEHVASEVKYFDNHCDPNKILVVDVGASTQPKFPILDKALKKRQNELLFQSIPGSPTAWTRQDKQKYHLEAAAILATLVGVKDKRGLDARVRKIWACMFLILAIVASILYFANHRHRQWLETAEGLRYQALLDIQAYSANNYEFDDPKLTTTATAFGRMGDADSISALVDCVRDSDFKAIVESCGLLALDPPQISDAKRLLNVIESSSGPFYSSAIVLLHAAENRPLNDQEMTPNQLAESIELLALAGHRRFAQTHILGRDDFPPEKKLTAAVQLVDANDKHRPLDPETIELALEGLDGAQRLDDLTELLLILDLSNCLDSQAASQIAPVAIEAASEADLSDMLQWQKVQQLAAHLAAIGEKTEAERILNATKSWADSVANDSTKWDHHDTKVFFWRSLAFQRCGDTAESIRYYMLANDCFPIGDRTRTYWEVMDIAMIHVCWDDWRSAFKWADKAREPRTNFEIRCRLIELWAIRDASLLNAD